jgi:hypothetical protein
MRNLTPSELFSKGYNAIKQKEYLIAEKYFLASLFEYSKEQKDYIHLIGSLDQLSQLYSQGKFENKDRALRFYKTFSKVDHIVSAEYAMALINGFFVDSDPNLAIRQLSKAKLDNKLFILACMLHEGKVLEKDDYKAALLLKSEYLEFSYRANQAKELYDSIGIEVELTKEELEKQVRKNLDELFKGYTLELEKYPTNKESLVVDFFANKENIPDIEILTDEELPRVK